MPLQPQNLSECLQLILERSEKLRKSDFIDQGSLESFSDRVASLETNVKDELGSEFKANTKDVYFLTNYLYGFLEKIKYKPLAEALIDRPYFNACHKLLERLHSLDCYEQEKQAGVFYKEFCVLEAKRAIAKFLELIANFTEHKLIDKSLNNILEKYDLNNVTDLLSDAFDQSKISELLLDCMAFVGKGAIDESGSAEQIEFFKKLNELFTSMCQDDRGRPSFSPDNYPKFEQLGKLVTEFSKLADRQSEFAKDIETFFQLSEACVNHSAWSKTTRKLGVPEAIESHKRCLQTRYTCSQASVLQELHQKTFERWRLSPISRHPITDYYYEQHYQLTKQLKNFLVIDEQNIEFKRWLTEEDVNQVKKIIAQMEALRSKTTQDLDQRVVDSGFVPDVTIEPKRDDQARVVVTYNVQQLLTSYYPKERAGHLVNYLLGKADEASGVDVFILEEFFLPCALATLKKSRLAKDYHIIKPEGGDLLNSGVCILLKKSEFKDFKVTKIPFSFATSVDQLTPKGFTHIEVTDKDGIKSHIVGTHTQAQYTGSNHQIIATFAQLAELTQYLNRIPKTERLILAGDLNILRTDVPTMDPELFKYLIYPYAVHPVNENTYDPQKNYLTKKLDPNGAGGVLDYGISRGYELSEGEVLTDTKYRHGKEEREISDHYPVKFTLEAKNSEPDSPLTIEEKQRRILAKLLCVAFKEACETNLLGQWKTGRAKEVYFSVCKLIKHYEGLTQEGAEALGTGSDFLNHCLDYNDPTEFASFLKKTDQDEDKPLSQLIDYRLLKGSSADLTLEVLRQDGMIEKIISILKDAKEGVDHPDWNNEGKNLFFKPSHCPDGIRRMRLYLENIESLSETELLETVFAIRDLLFEKTANSDELKARWFRDKKTQKAYTIMLTCFDDLIKCLPNTQGLTDKSNNPCVNGSQTIRLQLN
jgi:endonuclease/exonuclease/phosphatase family metal-dependent hydrolase